MKLKWFAYLLVLLILTACSENVEVRPNVDGFMFSIDPQTEVVTLATPSGNALSVQAATLPGETRVLVNGTDLELADFSFSFKPGNVLEIQASFKNITTNLNFLQPFFFTAISASNIVSSTEPTVSDEDLGGDRVLSPGETTAVLTFEVAHKGQPFTYSVEANAAVEEVEGDGIVVTLPSKEPVTREVTVFLPDPTKGEIGADVMFLFDRTGSFNDDLTTFRNQANNIVASLKSSLADLRVGLSSFADAPCSPFGGSIDFGYELNLPLTSNTSQFSSTLSALNIRNGFDTPESQLEAMFQALTGEGRTVSGFGACDDVADIAPTTPGYQSGRFPFLLVSTDAPFHRPTDPGYPYPTSVDDVIDTAQASGTTIFFLNSGSTDAAAGTIANATGGDVFNLSGDSSGVVEAIREAVSTTVSSVSVRLSPQGDDAGFVQSISPDRFADVDLTTTDSVTFAVTFVNTVAPGPTEQNFRFELIVTVDGVEIDRIPVLVTIPATS